MEYVYNSTERVIGAVYEVTGEELSPLTGKPKVIAQYALIPPGTHILPPGGELILRAHPANKLFFEGSEEKEPILAFRKRVRQGDTHKPSEIAMPMLQRAIGEKVKTKA